MRKTESWIINLQNECSTQSSEKVHKMFNELDALELHVNYNLRYFLISFVGAYKWTHNRILAQCAALRFQVLCDSIKWNKSFFCSRTTHWLSHRTYKIVLVKRNAKLKIHSFRYYEDVCFLIMRTWEFANITESSQFFSRFGSSEFTDPMLNYVE